MVQFNVDFLGTTVVDKLFSNPMVPWVIADVKRRKKIQKVNLTVEDGEIIGKTENVVIFRHQTQNLHRFCLEPNNMRTFMYLLRDEFEPVLNVYLFQTPEFEDLERPSGKMMSMPVVATSDKCYTPELVKSNSTVVEIFQTMRESVRDRPNMTKSHSSAATLTSLCPDISPTNSQFFEVLYVGKMKVSHRKVPDTFIDDALERIRLYELEKSRKMEEGGEKSKPGNKNCDSGKPREPSDPAINIVNTYGDVNAQTSYDAAVVKTSLYDSEPNALPTCDVPDKKAPGESDKTRLDPPPERYNRTRAGSLGVIETFRKKVDDANQNRTMLFYVGRSDLRLISPDRKQVLLHKQLKDINSCIQGKENNQHFGIISREIDSYVSYVFKCESDSVADHIVSVISQSFHSARENKEKPKQPVLSCEHCPMVWFHKLCAEVEGVNEKKTQLTILKKIESLPEQEQMDIHTKFLGAESSDIKEQNEFLMILLRTHCERKQSRHVHDTAETRSEFLNQVLGGNTIFMKAKRSLTSSFDQLLKRKGSQTDIFHSKESASRKSDSTINECGNDEYQRPYLTVGSADGETMRKEISKQMNINRSENDNLKKTLQQDKSFSVEYETKFQDEQQQQPSFPDIAAITVNNQKIEKRIMFTSEENDAAEDSPSKTPMRNIFLTVGSTSKTPPHDGLIPEELHRTPSGSWRQAIFNRVVTPGKTEGIDDKEPRKKTKEELRDLWKTAINQQILLIRMERENARLRASQEEATVKRIKLEYDELGSFSKEYMGIWDLISNKDNRISSKCDSQILLQAVRQGIPRARRGEVWHFLAVQYCLKQPPFDSSGFSNYDVPYEDLLKQLTSFQHAILIDLGRTFPSHPYFSSPLGPGQLALFNLLKGYSLLDPQVGYCQGLSFIAGVLLLHMSEDMAFLLLRHLMFRRGLRKQYLPDMAALQVQLYQLSRLIHDTFPKLYAHFDRNEIAPTLYSASWMLTLFASQFPLGFVTRVFDLLFMEQTTEVIFRVIMALLDLHRDALLKKSSFEDIMDYLKTDVPKMDAHCVDKIMRKVLSMDITKQLHEYEVEYHVLQEEMSTPRPEIDQLRKMNRKLTDQNSALIDQLEMVNKNISRLEKYRCNQQGTISKLETKVRNLEITIKTLGDFILDVSEEHKDVVIPGEIRRIIANLELPPQPNGRPSRVEVGSKNSFDKTTFFKRMHSSIDFHEKPHFSELCVSADVSNSTRDQEEESGAKGEHKPGLTSVPLKVIVDDNDDRKKPLNSPNLTSKITSGVSSFFNSSHNQTKNQKNRRAVENPIKGPETHVDNRKPRHNFSREIGALNIKESVIHIKEKPPTSTESSACEDSGPDSSSSLPEKIHIHPLDTCSDVNITYNGTTKLKSIKSGHKLIRNNTIDLIPVKNGFLHISEDEVLPKEKTPELTRKSVKTTFTETF